VGFIPTGIGRTASTPAATASGCKYLWLAARYDDVVYRFDTANGDVARVKVGAEPHGLTVWPRPGRYSLGHTGNLR